MAGSAIAGKNDGRRGAFRIAKTVMTTWAAGSSPVWIFTQIDNPVGQNPGTLLLPYHFKKMEVNSWM